MDFRNSFLPCMEHRESGYLAFELSADATDYVVFDSRAVTLPDFHATNLPFRNLILL